MAKPRKRTAPPAQARPAKKQKETPRQSKAFERKYISIPRVSSDHDVQDGDDDDDGALLDEFGDTINFLAVLDQQGIARSKKETERLHQLHQPVRKPRADDLPSVDSHDEESEGWNTDIENFDAETRSDVDSDSKEQPTELDSDTEMPYERIPRLLETSEQETRRNIRGLPIKLPDGRIQNSGKLTVAPALDDDEDTEDSVRFQLPPAMPSTVEDSATGARFGRLAVVDVIGNKSRKARIQGAKDQIASICQEIISDPENSLGLLRRLHTFSLETITSQSHPEPVRNDIAVRKLAVSSQLAVFKDIIPGYRIRALTDKEKAEKVSQMVARTREWEQGLVLVYQSYLRALETEIKAKSDLADVALRCMCTLASDVTHFNFRLNLMACIVAHLSRKTWDGSSDLCLNTLISIFRNDLTGVPSLEAVQLLNRMIKERYFNVRPEVLTCLLHLRLKTELSVRASDSKVDKEDKVHPKRKRATKGKLTDRPYLSKRARKALKERKEIEREVREAEAQVDKEERARTHTETLKLLFVLYFRILKNLRSTPLLPAALRGIAKYAHLVNVDFFKDLMQVLKNLIMREQNEINSDAEGSRSCVDKNMDIQHRLLCILTAFELLSGQGEALNIDLSEFIDHLYAILLPISELLEIEDLESHPTIPDMLFRALTMVFSPRSAGSLLPWRTAAFAKRLLVASLNWSPALTLRALDFIGDLVAKEPKLEALLTTDDRHVDGVYLPEVDDPQLSHPFGTSLFELLQLQQRHYDPRVRESARRLSSYTRS